MGMYGMTKQVQLSDKAYTFLRASKREGESFSDVVLRLGKPKRDLLALAGKRTFGTPTDLARFRALDKKAERAHEERRRRLRRGGR